MELMSATTALAALGHPTRLSVFRLLVEAGHEGRTPGEIAEVLSLAGATLSFHLKELTTARLIQGETQGRHIRYRADFHAMTGLNRVLTLTRYGHDHDRCLPGTGHGTTR